MSAHVNASSKDRSQQNVWMKGEGGGGVEGENGEESGSRRRGWDLHFD